MATEPSGYFEDANHNKSSSRLNQTLIVLGGMFLTGLAIVYGQPEAAGIIFTATAGASGAVAWNNRTQEAKETIVDKSQPDADVTTKVNA